MTVWESFFCCSSLSPPRSSLFSSKRVIYLGTWPTLALIVFTGIVGAYLARRQGLSVLTRAQKQMARGDVPAGSLADGVLCQNSALLK